MMNRMRASATHSLAALALIGLTTSAPVQAVEVVPSANLEALEEAVATLPPPAFPPAAAPVVGAPAPVLESAPEPEPAYEIVGVGEASYYGYELAGNRTASGERFNPKALTAAHRNLPMGTKLRVTNQANGKSVIVRVNDRGPFVKHRILDLSLGAAERIAMVRSGKARVKIERIRGVA